MGEESKFNLDGVPLSEEQVAAILDWAVGTGVIAVIMAGAPQHTNPRETLDKLHHLMNGVEIMLYNLPDFMKPYIAAKADTIVENTIENEKIIADFVKDLDAL